jgi:hypothetical protein
LSDDDYLLPGFFESAAAALSDDVAAGLYAGSTLEFDESGALRYAPVLSWPREGRFSSDEAVLNMLDNRHPTWTGVIFRTASLRDVGGLDRAASQALDLDAELRVAAAAPILISFAPSAVYTVHESRVSAAQTAAVTPAFERIIANLERAPSLSPPVRDAAIKRLGHQLRMKLLEICVKAQVRGDRETARGAAITLRDRYRSPVLGRVLEYGVWTCSHFAPAQSLLEWIETTRQKQRAAHARQQAQRVKVWTQPVSADGSTMSPGSG